MDISLIGYQLTKREVRFMFSKTTLLILALTLASTSNLQSQCNLITSYFISPKKIVVINTCEVAMRIAIEKDFESLTTDKIFESGKEDVFKLEKIPNYNELDEYRVKAYYLPKEIKGILESYRGNFNEPIDYSVVSKSYFDIITTQWPDTISYHTLYELNEEIKAVADTVSQWLDERVVLVRYRFDIRDSKLRIVANHIIGYFVSINNKEYVRKVYQLLDNLYEQNGPSQSLITMSGNSKVEPELESGALIYLSYNISSFSTNILPNLVSRDSYSWTNISSFKPVPLQIKVRYVINDFKPSRYVTISAVLNRRYKLNDIASSANNEFEFQYNHINAGFGSVVYGTWRVHLLAEAGFGIGKPKVYLIEYIDDDQFSRKISVNPTIKPYLSIGIGHTGDRLNAIAEFMVSRPNISISENISNADILPRYSIGLNLGLAWKF
ncbi:MAG: hypothetical protein RLN81_02965 [Balneolaceae bacterium]